MADGESYRGHLYSRAIEGVTQILSETGSVPTISEVATAIGVPPETLTAVFPTPVHLLEAMAENAMMLLHHSFVQLVAQADADNPVEQFIAISNAYVEWGHRYPREFRIIGSMPSSRFEGNDRLLRFETSIHELMKKLLLRAGSMGLIAPDQDLDLFISIAHVYAYGVVSKMLLGDLARWNPGLSDLDAARLNLRVFIYQFLRPATAVANAQAGCGASPPPRDV